MGMQMVHFYIAVLDLHFLMTKRWDAAGDYRMKDSARNPYNVSEATIYTNTTAAEITENKIDFVANGVKIRVSRWCF